MIKTWRVISLPRKPQICETNHMLLHTVWLEASHVLGIFDRSSAPEIQHASGRFSADQGPHQYRTRCKIQHLLEALRQNSVFCSSLRQGNAVNTHLLLHQRSQAYSSLLELPGELRENQSLSLAEKEQETSLNLSPFWGVVEAFVWKWGRSGQAEQGLEPVTPLWWTNTLISADLGPLFLVLHIWTVFFWTWKAFPTQELSRHLNFCAEKATFRQEKASFIKNPQTSQVKFRHCLSQTAHTVDIFSW